MKKVCVITAARSEYGCLKWLMKDIQECFEFELQTVVTGAHLLSDQGYTVDLIKADGIQISETVDVQIDNSSNKTVCETMTRYSNQFTKVLSKLNPDCIIVLGDRYELLPICSVAFMLRIPIVHISGGDITEGALDDGIRNAITMLATYHFPGTQNSSENIYRMRNSRKNIYIVGEPGLESFTRESLFTRDELSQSLQIDPAKKWVLCTLHPETTKDLSYNEKMAENLGDALLSLSDDYQIIITKANTDYGGKEINQILKCVSDKRNNSIKQIASLGQLRYLSYMKQVEFVVGNSSSGIIETPFLEIPALNIGDRQKGRYQCSNIIQCNIEKDSIQRGFDVHKNNKSINDKYYWGDGNTSSKILSVLKKVL